MLIRAIDGDIRPSEAGTTLSHEHLWAPFGRATGDTDLELTCSDEVVADVREARAAGLATLVDATSLDMGADPHKSAAIARAAGVRVVKSTGWFRSPTADPHVEGRAVEQLAASLVRHIEHGFDDAPARTRAGCLGELGMSGTQPTGVEERVLDAMAAAALSTGVGLVLHTDNGPNAQALVGQLAARGVPLTQLLVGHARVADPIEWQVEMLQAGATIGFDQLGHPARDHVASVAHRIVALLEREPSARVTLSADAGRRSRLRAFGGSGLMEPFNLVAHLRAMGVADAVLARLIGGSAADFLVLRRSA